MNILRFPDPALPDSDTGCVGWADVRKPNSLWRSLMLGFLTSAQPTDYYRICYDGSRERLDFSLNLSSNA